MAQVRGVFLILKGMSPARSDVQKRVARVKCSRMEDHIDIEVRISATVVDVVNVGV